MGEDLNGESEAGWIKKANIVIKLANQVGIPSLIIIFFLTFLGLTWAGKIDSPFITKNSMLQMKELVDSHAISAAETHKSIMEQGEKNIQVLDEMKQSIKIMNCNMQNADGARLKCFEKMNKIIE